MKVAVSHPVLFFEHATYEKLPLVYSDDITVTCPRLVSGCPALVFDTDKEQITPESACMLIENTTPSPSGDIERLSPSLFAYLVYSYAVKRCHNTKQQPATGDLSSKPLYLRKEHRIKIPSVSRKWCAGPGPHSKTLSSEAKSFLNLSICSSCWSQIHSTPPTWHRLDSIRKMVLPSVFSSHFQVLQTPGTWDYLLGVALGFKGSYSHITQMSWLFRQHPIMLALVCPVSSLWVRIAPPKWARALKLFIKHHKAVDCMKEVGAELFVKGWIATPDVKSSHFRSVPCIVGKLFRYEAPPEPVLIRKLASGGRVFSNSFYTCMSLLNQSTISLTLTLTAPFFAKPPCLSLKARDITPKSIVSGTVTECEMLTWETLSILLTKSDTLSLSGSYIAAAYGIDTGIDTITFGCPFMYLVDWAINQAPFKSITLTPIDDDIRPTSPIGIDDEPIISAWDAATKALKVHFRPKWPPALQSSSSLHPKLKKHANMMPLPKVDALLLPMVVDARATRNAKRFKQPYNSILKQHQPKRRKLY